MSLMTNSFLRPRQLVRRSCLLRWARSEPLGVARGARHAIPLRQTRQPCVGRNLSLAGEHFALGHGQAGHGVPPLDESPQPSPHASFFDPRGVARVQLRPGSTPRKGNPQIVTATQHGIAISICTASFSPPVSTRKTPRFGAWLPECMQLNGPSKGPGTAGTRCTDAAALLVWVWGGAETMLSRPSWSRTANPSRPERDSRKNPIC